MKFKAMRTMSYLRLYLLNNVIVALQRTPLGTFLFHQS
jgi:hypothetical protein